MSIELSEVDVVKDSQSKAMAAPVAQVDDGTIAASDEPSQVRPASSKVERPSDWRLRAGTNLSSLIRGEISLTFLRGTNPEHESQARQEANDVAIEFRATPTFKRQQRLRTQLASLDSQLQQSRQSLASFDADYEAALLELADGDEQAEVKLSDASCAAASYRDGITQLSRERDVVARAFAVAHEAASAELHALLDARRYAIADNRRALESEAIKEINALADTVFAPVDLAAAKMVRFSAETGEHFVNALIGERPAG